MLAFGPRPVEQACVAIISTDGAVVGPGITDANGRWEVDGLANDTPFVVGVIPPFSRMAANRAG